MKSGIAMSVIILSIVLGSTVYATETETKPEKGVVAKTITVTTIQRPFRGTIRHLKNSVNRLRILRTLRSKLRSLLGGVVEDATPVEQEVEK